MELLDDQGRLFGLVNVVDALAVLLVAAVVVAGVAFVLQPDPATPAPPETATRQVSLDLGTQPGYLVERIQAGDSYSPVDGSNLTVTDVYLAPQGGTTVPEGNPRVVLSVELEAQVEGDTIAYDGAPPRLGRELIVQTDAYQVTGTIRDVGGELTLGTTDVLANATVEAATANAIQPGDAYTLAGREVATVESVESYATRNPDQRRVFLGLSLATVDFGDGPQFGDTLVRQGTTIPFRTSDYALSGEVRRVGATEPRGEPTTRTVTLQLSGVDPRVADSLRAGMTERGGEEVIARITNVETEPATVVLTGQDGRIFLREHPIRKDVTLATELRIRETTGGPMFKGRLIRQGSTVVLDLGTTTVEARVASL